MDGRMMARAHLTFTGRFVPGSFEAFAAHRARRLDLSLGEVRSSATTVSATVAGADALIDAFEMACSLGPLDCLVLDVTREDEP